MNTRIRSPSLVWNLTLEQSKDIERIEKRAIRIIHPQYEYNQALVVSNLKTLKERRDDLCVGLIKNMLQPTHRLHSLLLGKLGDIKEREIRANGQKICNIFVKRNVLNIVL